MRLLKVVFAGFIAGVLISLVFPDSNLIFSYAQWRAAPVGGGFMGIALNNILVVALVLYGGILFSLLEVGSYGSMPPRVYGFLDMLSSPLHWAFSVFDKRILSMENPLKSCFFLSVSFPVMVLFLNLLLFSHLVLYGLLNLGLLVPPNILALALAEFACITAAAIPAYAFPIRYYPLYEGNHVDVFRGACMGYLLSVRNFLLLVSLSVILSVLALIEESMMM